MLTRDVIEYDNLQSLAGFFSFAAKVVRPGRALLRRIFDALAKHRRHIRLCPQIKANLQWWNYFLPRWNGISPLEDPAKKPLIRMWTEASGKFGMGGYYLAADELLGPNQAYSQRFLSQLQPKHISVKETRAVLFAFRRWLHILAGKHILLYGDSFAVSQGLKHLSIKGPSRIPIHRITMLIALHNITISSIQIPRKKNALADMLSRGLWNKIADVYPQLLPTH